MDLTSSTHKTYKAAERKYLSFCNDFSITPIPQMYNVGGFPDPLINHMPRLRQVLKGIKVQT